MISVIGSIFDKLLGYEKKEKAAIATNNSTAVNITIENVSGNVNLPEKIEKSLSSMKTGNVIEQDSKDTIRQLKRDILMNSEKMSIIDLIGKAYTIAELMNDKEKSAWLQWELNGYPIDKDRIPDYRKIHAKLDIGLTFYGSDDFLDLREKPIRVIYPGGLSTIWSLIQNNPRLHQMNFLAPIIPDFMEIMRKSKLPLSGNFDEKSAPYFIERHVLDSLITKVKQEVLSYVSSV